MLDPSKINEYSDKGQTKASGEIDESTSYDFMLNNCSDFANERTLVQYIMSELGSECDRSPKCHPEVAGEGVEYSLGKSKNWFRTFPVEDKKGVEKFKRLVNLALKANDGAMITIQRVRKYSRRARRYIVAYHQLDRGMPVEDVNFLKRIEERVRTLKKSHRDAIDTKFIYES